MNRRRIQQRNATQLANGTRNFVLAKLQLAGELADGGDYRQASKLLQDAAGIYRNEPVLLIRMLGYAALLPNNRDFPSLALRTLERLEQLKPSSGTQAVAAKPCVKPFHDIVRACRTHNAASLGMHFETLYADWFPELALWRPERRQAQAAAQAKRPAPRF